MFRLEKSQILHDKFQVDQILQERLKIDAKKKREIFKIIKTEQSNELQKNLNVFLNLNNEERILRQELVDKQHELQQKEK